MLEMKFLRSDSEYSLEASFRLPEPLSSQGELIIYPCSGAVRCPPFSKILFSKTAWPIEAKFHMGPPWEGETKVAWSKLHDQDGCNANIWSRLLEPCSPKQKIL